MERHMSTSEARKIAQDLIAKHWDTLAHYRVTFDGAKRRAGQCDYRKRVISLSKYLLAQRSYEESLNTITHEIAHAIVGPKHGHDYVWSRKHRELGGDGQRCFAHVDEKAPWIGTCSHGKRATRYRAPQRLEGWRCRCPQGSTPVVWERNAA